MRGTRERNARCSLRSWRIKGEGGGGGWEIGRKKERAEGDFSPVPLRPLFFFSRFPTPPPPPPPPLCASYAGYARCKGPFHSIGPVLFGKCRSIFDHFTTAGPTGRSVQIGKHPPAVSSTLLRQSGLPLNKSPSVVHLSVKNRLYGDSKSHVTRYFVI